MLNRPIVLIVLGGVLAVGAGTGAYLGVRSNAVDRPMDVAFPADQSELSNPGAVDAVEATETVVDAPAAPTFASPAKDVEPVSAPPAASPERRRSPAREADGNVQQAASPPARVDVGGARPSGGTAPPPAATAAPDRADEARLDEIVSDVPLAAWDERAVGTAIDPEPKPRIFEDLILSADSVIGLQLDTPVSSETARVEDPVDARVTRDVMVGSRVAIPAGSQVRGSVVLVEQGGKVKDVARLGIRFHTVVLEDGGEVPIVTETIYRDGQSPTGESVAKIGGAAVGGAILGAILGGSRGAVIGGSAGAAGGTAAVMAGGRNPATFAAGAAVTVRLSQPATVTVEQ